MRRVEKKPVLVLRATGRSPTIEHLMSAEKFLSGLRADGWDVMSLFSDLSDIGHNRDELAKFFVRGPSYKRFAYCLWIDDDMVVPGLDMKSGEMRAPGDAMERLVYAIEKSGVGISSTVSCGRRAPFGVGPQINKSVGVSEEQLLNLTARAGFGKAVRVGMAFTLVKREVFEALVFPWFRAAIDALPEWQALCEKVKDGREVKEEDLRQIAHSSTKAMAIGEDYLFCDRAVDAGFAVEIDWGTWTGHEFPRVGYPSLYLDAQRRVREADEKRAASKIVIAH